MGLCFIKVIQLILVVGGMFVFVASCKMAPTVQLWYKGKGEMTMVDVVPVDNTPKPEETEKTVSCGAKGI
ncbi:MAG: hypothetical protein ACOX6S_14435 [Clostridia bacterium]|jgi:hypothetical protein